MSSLTLFHGFQYCTSNRFPRSVLPFREGFLLRPGIVSVDTKIQRMNEEAQNGYGVLSVSVPLLLVNRLCDQHWKVV